MLGAKAQFEVSAATTLHFGQWLGWPDWLRDGTSLQGSGQLPRMLTLADDLIIIGNIIDNADVRALLDRMLTVPRPVMGITGMLSLLHAPDLGSALRMVVRGMAAQSPHLMISLDETPEYCAIGFKPAWPMGPMFDFSVLTAFALLYRSLEALSFADPGEMALESSFNDKIGINPWLPRFRCRVEKTKELERLCFPTSWQSIANPDYDPLLWAVAQTKIASLEQLFGEPEDVARIRSTIADMLTQEQRVPRLKQISTTQQISSRTIVRQLARHGSSFHKLVEQERRARAVQLIADPAISLSETAQLLGFTDISSFSRSFRQWFGDTPGNVRKAHLRGDGAP